MPLCIQVGQEGPLVIKWAPESFIPVCLGEFMPAAIDNLVGRRMLNAVPVRSVTDNGP